MGSQSITLNTTQRVWQTPKVGFVGAANDQPNVTTSEPNQGNNVLEVIHSNLAKLVFICAKADNSAVSEGGTHDTGVYSWSMAGGVWIPTYIATFKVTSGTSTGAGSAALGDTIYFCKDVELVDGDTSSRVIGGAEMAEITPGASPTAGDSDVIASATVDCEGATYLSFRHAARSTTADRFGVLVATF
tara:strand:+ start:186 stop:749 length:564 start_codon:yes stop_codon:yes gene_type:complete